jgi:hypothetical protein
MFAFSNMIRAKQNKSLINYKRVSFVKKLLQIFVLNNNGNQANYTELKDVFGKDQAQYVDNVLYELNDVVYKEINKLNYSILEICSTVNKSKDEIVTELCDLADMASRGELIKEAQVKEVNTNRKNVLPPLRPMGPPRDSSTPIGKMEARIREINRSLKQTLNRTTRSKLMEEKKLLMTKVQELEAAEESSKFAETYKEMVVTKIQRAIDNIKGYEREHGISDKLRKKIQTWKSNFIRDITLLRKNSPSVVYSKKALLDNLLEQIKDIEESILADMRAERNIVPQSSPTIIMLPPGTINATSHSIWTGERWVRPQEVDPTTRSLWSGSQWFPQNYVDIHSGTIWTGFRWIKPHEYNPDNNLIWSGREWLPVPGTIDASTGAFWNGNMWIKKGQVNPQTGLYWDGYNWNEFNKFTGQWQPIRRNQSQRSTGILSSGQLRKGGLTFKNSGKFKNNNFTRRK